MTYSIDISTPEGMSAAAAMRALGVALEQVPRLYAVRQNGELIRRHNFRGEGCPLPGCSPDTATLHRAMRCMAAGKPWQDGETPSEKLTPEALQAIACAWYAASHVFDIQEDIKTREPLVEYVRGDRRYFLPADATPGQIAHALLQ